MLSNDRALLGEAASTGDTIARHRAYGQFVEKLAIIVLTKKGRFKTNQLSETVYAYPTNAHGVFCCLKNGLAIAKKLLAAENYDLVVCQDPFLTGLVGWRLKNKYGLKLLLHFHGDFWDNPYWLKENIFHLLMLWLSKCTVKRADAIRVVSGGIKTPKSPKLKLKSSRPRSTWNSLKRRTTRLSSASKTNFPASKSSFSSAV